MGFGKTSGSLPPELWENFCRLVVERGEKKEMESDPITLYAVVSRPYPFQEHLIKIKRKVDNF